MSEIHLVREEIDSDIILLRLAGSRATMDSAIGFKNSLLREIDEGHRKLILDFDGVVFVDSSFIGAVVVAWKKMSSLRGKLILVNVSEKVKVNMSITRVDKSVLILNSIDEAARFLQN